MNRQIQYSKPVLRPGIEMKIMDSTLQCTTKVPNKEYIPDSIKHNKARTCV